MTREIQTAITAIANVLSDVNGLKRAPANPMENLNEYPFAMTYLLNGTINNGPVGTKKSLTNIAIDVLVPRRDINLDLDLLVPFLDSIPLALLSEVSPGGDIFGGTISTFGDIVIEFQPAYIYAGVQMIGYRFIMQDVKILVNL
jgi:hypothetical protein